MCEMFLKLLNNEDEAFKKLFNFEGELPQLIKAVFKAVSIRSLSSFIGAMVELSKQYKIEFVNDEYREKFNTLYPPKTAKDEAATIYDSLDVDEQFE